MFFIELLIFYLFASFAVYCCFYLKTNRHLVSLVFAVLLVFISSEFWELPIFIRGYLGITKLEVSSVFNHLFVGIMAYLLVWLSNFKPTWKKGLILLGCFIFNYIVLIQFPHVIPAWIIRAISLTVLTLLFLNERLPDGYVW